MKNIIKVFVISLGLLLLSGCNKDNTVDFTLVMFGDEVVESYEKESVVDSVTYNEYAGYTFVGWYYDEELSDEVESFPLTLTDDTTLYAYYSSNTYTLTFDTVGGSEIEPVTATSNTHLIEPSDPLKEGYQFVNWYVDADYTMLYHFDGKTMQPNDFTIYAKWEQLYTLSLVVDGETTYKYYDGLTVIAVPENPVKEGYVFEGWYSNGIEYGFNCLLSSDVTCEAVFHSQNTSVEVSYYNGSNLVATSDNLKEGETLVHSVLADTEYTYFAGWYTDAAFNKAATDYVPSEDTVYYALFVQKNEYAKISYTVDDVTNYVYVTKGETVDAEEWSTLFGTCKYVVSSTGEIYYNTDVIYTDVVIVNVVV